MAKYEFYKELEIILNSCGIDDTMRGYMTFLRLSYRKYQVHQNGSRLDMVKKLNKQSKNQYKEIIQVLKKNKKYSNYIYLCLGKKIGL